MEFPLAYHITWTTYGTWLPGDERGWVSRKHPGVQTPDPDINEQAMGLMEHDVVVLTDTQRTIVGKTIEDHCRIRNWLIHVYNVRTNHIHVVLVAACQPEKPLEELKAWSSRRLNAAAGEKRHWWTYHGSTKWIWDEVYLQNAIQYVRDAQ